ncbi:MAG: spore coat protein U-like protein [Janthinobacterium sp.]|jgi:spore coat protein U-like protein
MNMKLNKLALAIGAMTIAGASFAQSTDSSTLGTSATVENACAIGSGAAAAGTLTLDVNAGAGTVNATNIDFDSGTSISIACTIGASAQITAGLGNNAGVGTTRSMLSGTDTLAYELYADAVRATVLNGTNGIAYTGTGATTTNTVIYGQITGTQLAAAPKGTYADTVAMTITYTP